MASHLEVERKFDAGPGFELPEFGELPGCARVTGPARYHLVATYYDTPDERLAANRITLRRRIGGADDGWHLKLPAGQDARHELHAPLEESAERNGVPSSLAAVVAEITAGLPLAPIAVLATDRVVLTLIAGTGEAVTEVADDTVTARRTPDGPSRTWREVEVEALAEGPGLLEAASGLLLAAGAWPASSGSKLARLLGS